MANEPKLVIDRYEFLMLDSQYHRWQLFEHVPYGAIAPITSDGQYRPYILEMLRAVDETLADAARKSDGRLGRRKQGSGSVQLPTLVPELSKRLREYNLDKKLLQSVLSVYRARLDESSIVDGQKRRLKLVLDALEHQSGDLSSLPVQDAMDLLSIAYIRHDWDIAGMHLSSKRNKKFASEYIRRSMTSWTIEYGDDDPAEPLGYPVTLSACTGSGMNPGKRKGDVGYGVKSEATLRRENFFDVCSSRMWEPDRGNEFERTAYLVYGLLIDHFHQNLREKESRKLYYITYPIIGYGFQHFLNIVVHPETGELTPNELWTQWAEVIHNGSTGCAASFAMFKESLRELITDIRMRVFQRRVVNAIQRRQVEHVFTDVPELEVFAENAHHILYMQSIRTDNPKRIGESIQYGYTTAQQTPVGHEEVVHWGFCGNGAPISFTPNKSWLHPVPKSRFRYQADAIWNKKFAGPQQELFLRTSELRMERNYHWLQHRYDVLKSSLALPKHVPTKARRRRVSRANASVVQGPAASSHDQTDVSAGPGAKPHDSRTDRTTK